MDEATVQAAWASCNVHYAAIKYETSGKLHSIYRRQHGPDGDFHKPSGDRQGNPAGVSAWEKEGGKFSAFELMTGCWRSKQTSGAPNVLNTDFQMFSTEKAYFERSSAPGWTSCNYDDCGGNTVGFPRDCGPTGPAANQWHQFTEGKAQNGQRDVAFYVNTCGGWTPPIIELGDPTGGGWLFVFLLLLVGLGYFVGGAAFAARRKGEPLKKGPAMLKVHPHYGKWLQLHGLVQDGVNFSRARIDAKRGVKRTSYATVSQRPAVSRGDVQHEGHSGGTRGKSKRSGKDAKSKSAKLAKSKKSAKSTNAAKDAAADEVPAAETAAEEKERILQEERSAGVHSSQQAIRIVGING